MDKFKERIAAIRTEADDAVARAEEAEKELSEVKDQISAKDQETISYTNRIKLLESQLEKSETGGSDSQQQVRSLEAQVEELEGRVGHLEGKKETLESAFEDLQKEYAQLQSDFNEAEAALNDL
ncbi:MAG: hypothetical protein J3Q66DRAFT_343613 [Benniella sp.]|nr:MAG: hypothetical protein J3Q66DRAFT_343613 [Benniella sp.]